MKSKTHSIQHLEILDTYLPEDVLKQFVADLQTPINIIDNSLRGLPNLTNYHNGEETFYQLGQASQTINEKIRLVIAYLNLKLKDGFIETEGKIAFEILGQFTHMLRDCSISLKGYVSVCQQCKLSEEVFKQNTETIEYHGKRLVKIFKVLDSNWEIWVETKIFDWEASGL